MGQGGLRKSLEREPDGYSSRGLSLITAEVSRDGPGDNPEPGGVGGAGRLPYVRHGRQCRQVHRL